MGTQSEAGAYKKKKVVKLSREKWFPKDDSGGAKTNGKGRVINPGKDFLRERCVFSPGRRAHSRHRKPKERG